MALELREIKHRQDSEDVVNIECPFCEGRGDYMPADAVLFQHGCKATNNETVFFLNGYALAGAAAYLRTNLPKGRT